MQAITSRPETEGCSAAAVLTSVSSSGSPAATDIALIAAILVPLTIMGVLVLIGVGVGAAVAIMFVAVFATTTTLDVRWLLQSRRARNDARRSQE